MTSLKKKMKKEGGFTLIEMLIVVAIIAILVAVSIPLVNSALDKAQKATDAANERAAKASAAILVFDNQLTAAAMYYDIEAGEIVTMPAKPKTYGKCSEHKGGYLTAKLENKKIMIEWAGCTNTDLDGTGMITDTPDTSAP